MRSRWGLTVRASCLLAAGLTALICGAALGDIDLVRAGALIVALPLLALVVVHYGRLQISNIRRIEPERLNAGEGVTVQLGLRNNSLLPTGALMLEDQLPAQLRGRARFGVQGLGGREERIVHYRIPALPRGRYRSGPLQLRLTDPFHLVDLMRSFTATADVLVGPVVERLPGTTPPRSHDVGDNAGSHSVGTHGADDASTREYRTGDDLRKIHWRSSARTGALMVRQEERPWQGRATLLLDLRASAHARGADSVDPRRADSLEWAISAAASISTHLLLARQDVQLVYGGANHPLGSGAAPLANPGHVRDVFADLGPSHDHSLAAAAVTLARAARDSTLIAILGEPDPATLHMLLQAHTHRRGLTSIALVLDTRTWAAAPRDNEVTSTSASAAVSSGAVPNAVRRLAAAGWQVQPVRSGDQLPLLWQSLSTQRLLVP